MSTQSDRRNFFWSKMRRTDKNVEKYFALALKKGSHVSSRDIEYITKEWKLEPIFLAYDEPESIQLSRFMARMFDAPLLRISSYKDFREGVAHCSFSVCESLKPTVFSIISGKPAYVDVNDEKCRSFMGKMAKAGCPKGILIPYTKNRLSNIKKVGACGSDFKMLIDDIIRNIPFS